MSTLSNLAQGRVHAANAVPVPAPAVPVPPAAQLRVDVERLTTADVHELSTATINALIPHNRALVAQLIVDAGRKARGELPTAPLSSLRPAARAITLAAEKARGRQLNGEETEFLSAFLVENFGAS